MAGRRGMLSNNWELKELNLTLHWSMMTKRACHRSGAVILLHEKCYLIFYKLCPVSVLYWQTSLVSVLLQLPSKSSQWREDVDVHQEVIKTKKISITSTTIHTLYQMWVIFGQHLSAMSGKTTDMKQTNIVLSARATMTQMFLFSLVLVQRP